LRPGTGRVIAADIENEYILYIGLASNGEDDRRSPHRGLPTAASRSRRLRCPPVVRGRARHIVKLAVLMLTPRSGSITPLRHHSRPRESLQSGLPTVQSTKPGAVPTGCGSLLVVSRKYRSSRDGGSRSGRHPTFRKPVFLCRNIFSLMELLILRLRVAPVEIGSGAALTGARLYAWFRWKIACAEGKLSTVGQVFLLPRWAAIDLSLDARVGWCSHRQFETITPSRPNGRCLEPPVSFLRKWSPPPHLVTHVSLA
jgi:hypothetical protein